MVTITNFVKEILKEFGEIPCFCPIFKSRKLSQNKEFVQIPKVFLNKMSDHDDHSLKDLISLKLRVTRNWTFFTSRDQTSLNFRVLDFPKDRKYAQTEFRTSEWDGWRQKLRNRFSSHRTASIDLELFSAQYEISQKKVFGELENGADVSWMKKK